MAQLSEHDKSRVRFHLGYSSYEGIPAQDVGELEEAMNEIYGDFVHSMHIQMLDRLDKVFANTNMVEEPSNYKRIYVGDLNRSQVEFDLAKARRQWWQVYMQDTDILGLMLHVRNYWNPTGITFQGKYERTGAEYINVVPGVPDTSISSRALEVAYLGGGGFGGFEPGLEITGPTGANGADGAAGASAYQVWLNAGNVGTEEDFLNSLIGAGTNFNLIYVSPISGQVLTSPISGNVLVQAEG
ncbi:MAG: hypothetical protein AAGA83_00290 [Cyanobacteria bacterium P01_F01_bin.116]